jgi:hypothetical protein
MNLVQVNLFQILNNFKAVLMDIIILILIIVDNVIQFA